VFFLLAKGKGEAYGKILLYEGMVREPGRRRRQLLERKGKNNSQREDFPSHLWEKKSSQRERVRGKEPWLFAVHYEKGYFARGGGYR